MKLPVHKDFFLDRRIRSGYGLAFLLLLISYFLIFFTNKKLEEQAGWVESKHCIGKTFEITLDFA